MWEQIRANKRRSVGLVIIMAGILLLFGYALGEYYHSGWGPFGMVIAFIVWVIQALVSYYQGGKIILKMSRARRVTKAIHPTLYNVVEEMQIAAGLPRMPEIYIMDDPAPNAFATGRDPHHAAVAVTTGLLERLNRDELQGVIAHELAHVKNRDVLYMTMVGIMLGTIVLLADFGARSLFFGRRRTSAKGGGQLQLILFVAAIVLIILAPIIAQFIYYAVSRKREYLADACAVQFTRYPAGLAGALQKISETPLKLQSATRATAPMYIINPLKLTKQGLSNLSSTHPATSERIKVLRAMGGASLADYEKALRKTTRRAVGAVPASALETVAPLPILKPGAPSDIVDGLITTAAAIEGLQPLPSPAQQLEQPPIPEQKPGKQSPTPEQQPKRPSPTIERKRETTDALWRLNGYIFVSCFCGTNLKIPPVYTNKFIECPHCMTSHKVLPPES